MSARPTQAARPLGPSELARLARVVIQRPGLYAMERDGAELPAMVTYGPTPDPFDPTNIMDRQHWWSLFVGGRQVGDEQPEIGRLTNSNWPLIGRPIDRAEYDQLLSASRRREVARPVSTSPTTYRRPIQAARPAPIDAVTLFTREPRHAR